MYWLITISRKRHLLRDNLNISNLIKKSYFLTEYFFFNTTAVVQYHWNWACFLFLFQLSLIRSTASSMTRLRHGAIDERTVLLKRAQSDCREKRGWNIDIHNANSNSAVWRAFETYNSIIISKDCVNWSLTNLHEKLKALFTENNKFCFMCSRLYNFTIFINVTSNLFILIDITDALFARALYFLFFFNELH